MQGLWTEYEINIGRTLDDGSAFLARDAPADANQNAFFLEMPHLAFQPDSMSNLKILPMTDVVTSYYLRLRVADEAGVLAKVTGLLAEANISIDAVLQREADQVSQACENQTDVIILTHDTREGVMNEVLTKMQSLPTVMAPITKIRKEELN